MKSISRLLFILNFEQRYPINTINYSHQLPEIWPNFSLAYIYLWSKVCFWNIFENVATGFFLIVSFEFILYKVKKQRSQAVMTKCTYLAF